MHQSTYIISNWTKQAEEVKKVSLATRYAYYKEFKESVCDMFSYQDFEHYAEMTGLKFSTIKRMAKYSPDHGAYVEATNEARLISHILKTPWQG